MGSKGKEEKEKSSHIFNSKVCLKNGAYQNCQ